MQTIILCFNGYCGDSCSKYSHICPSNHRSAKYYVPTNVKLRITDTDEQVLLQCLKVFMGPKSIANTQF